MLDKNPLRYSRRKNYGYFHYDCNKKLYNDKNLQQILTWKLKSYNNF